MKTNKKKSPIITIWKLSKHKYMFFMQIIIKIFLSFVAIYVSKFARGVVDNGGFKDNILKEVAIFGVLITLGIAGSYFYEYFRRQYANELSYELRNKCMERTLYCDFEVIENEHSGAITNKITHNVSSVAEYISGGLAEFIGNMIAFVCCFVYLLTVNYQMVLTCAICIPITLLFTKKLANPTYKTMEDFENKMDEIDIMAKDTIMNQKTEKAFGIKDIRREKFDKTMDEATKSYVMYEKLVAKASPVRYLLDAAPTLICILVGFINSYYGNITSGEFVSVVLLLEYISKPLASFIEYITDYKAAKVSMERVGEILELPKEKDGTYTKEEIIDEKDSCFRFENVSFSYDNTLVLNNLNIDFKQGKMIALVGESGSGKSTLMKLMLGLLHVNEGSFSIKGKDITKWKLEDLRQEISYVEQTPYLFSGTIEENIKAGNPSATDEEMLNASKLAFAHDFIMDFENGYKSEVKEGGKNLSGGQRQRIAIARALIKNSDILLLDEMSSALDSESEKYICQTIEQCRKTKTIIMIAHRLKSIVSADEIYVLKNGTVVEKGTHDNLLKQGNIYKRLYQSEREVC